MAAETSQTQTELTARIEKICQRFITCMRIDSAHTSLETWVRMVPPEARDDLRRRLVELQMQQQQTSLRSTVSRVHLLDLPTNMDPGGSQESLAFSPVHETDEAPADSVAACRTFRGLSADALATLRDAMEVREYGAGEVLCEQGAASRGLYLILDGGVEILDPEKQVHIDYDGPGSVLGEMSLLTGQSCSARVVTITAVTAQVLSVDAYQRIRARHPELEIALSQLVSDRLGAREQDALCGKSIAGYRLERCVGRGGMGVIYQALQESTGDHVALKMLRHRYIYDEGMVHRFDREASLLAELRHPNIVAFRGHFLAYRTRFLVLDLCDGSDLYRVIRRHERLTEEQARAVLGQVAQGLLYAHQREVVHRDLKPANLLIDREGRISITDFGLSQIIQSETERKAVGTPVYMAPEQFQLMDTGPACDWYAFGCLAYELLSGKLLFPQQSHRSLLQLKSSSHPSEYWPDCDASPEYLRMMHSALAPNAAERRLDLERISTWARNLPELLVNAEPV